MKPSRAMSFTSLSKNYQMIPIQLMNLNCGSDKRLIMSLPMVIRRMRLKHFSRRILKNWRKQDLLQPKLSNLFWLSDEGKNQTTLQRHSLQPVLSLEILNMIKINLNFIVIFSVFPSDFEINARRKHDFYISKSFSQFTELR